MLLNFTKMHGIGNDFVVIDAINQNVALNKEQIRYIASRRIGVGCDQVLLVEPSTAAEVDFVYRIFNADGTEAEQCGNGARCFMQFVRDKGLTQQNDIAVQTLSGLTELSLLPSGEVKVNMQTPDFEPQNIPFSVETMALSYKIMVHNEKIDIGAVSMGNPHAVVQTDNVDTAEVSRLGQAIQLLPEFPEQVNVGFMQVLSPKHIRLRVYERGAGETLACGSGACAAVAIGRAQEILDESVRVSLQGGDLVVDWKGVGSELWMTGPAETIFEGKIVL